MHSCTACVIPYISIVDIEELYYSTLIVSISASLKRAHHPASWSVHLAFVSISMLCKLCVSLTYASHYCKNERPVKSWMIKCFLSVGLFWFFFKKPLFSLSFSPYLNFRMRGCRYSHWIRIEFASQLCLFNIIGMYHTCFNHLPDQNWMTACLIDYFFCHSEEICQFNADAHHSAVHLSSPWAKKNGDFNIFQPF